MDQSPQPPNTSYPPGGPPPPMPYANAPVPGQGKAIAALVLGIVSLLTWCLPILGLPIALIGLILGIQAHRAAARGMAVAGIVLCAIGLTLGVVNAGYGAYLGATGRNPLVNRFLQATQPAASTTAAPTSP